MPFPVRLFRRFPVQCVVSYAVGPFRGIGTVWNLSRSGWRLSGDLPMRPGESLSLTVTLPNAQRIEIPDVVVRWSRGQEFGIETVETPKHTADRLIHYVRRLVNDSVGVNGHDASHRMLKKSASGVLTSLRGSTYRGVRLASSLAAALLDSLFEHPARCSLRVWTCEPVRI